MRNQFGFSLVELVAVIVLIAILSVFIAPRFSSTSGYDEYVVRDQLISAIRATQQLAMFDHAANRCYRINVTEHAYAVQISTDNGATFGSSAASARDFDAGAGDAGVTRALNNVSLSAMALYFDGLGNSVGPTGFCAGGSAGNRALRITTASGSAICIDVFSTGYVRAATSCP